MSDKLVFKSQVDNSGLDKGLKQVQSKTKKTLSTVSDGIQGVSGGVNGILGLFKKMGPVGKIVAVSIGAIGAAIAGALALVNKLANRMDDVAKSAKSVNMTTKAFQQLQYAAGLSGVGMDKIMAIITTLSQRLVQAEQGVKNVVDGFFELGISWSELQKMAPHQQLIEIIAAAEKITDVTKRNKVLFKLFQKEDIRSLNKLIDVDFGRVVANAKNMGITIDEQTIRMAEMYNDSLSTATKRIVAMASNLKITKEAMKFLADMANEMTQNLSRSNGKIDQQYKNYYVGIGDVAEELYKAFQKDPEIYKAVKAEIDKVAKEIASMRRPFGTGPGTPKFIHVTQQDKDAAWQRVMFKYASYKDTRFDPNNRNTWVQKRKEPLASSARDPEKIKQDQIRSAISRTIIQLDKKAQKHQQNYEALEKILSVQQLIQKIQQETNGKLSQQQKGIVSQAFYEYRLKRDKEIFQNIKKQNEALKAQHQLQKAIIDGDTKRVEILKAMQRLKDKGVAVEQSDFANADQNYQNAQQDVINTTAARDSHKADKDIYTNATEMTSIINKKMNDNRQQAMGALTMLEKSGDAKQIEQITHLLNALGRQYDELKKLYQSWQKKMKSSEKGAKQFDRLTEKLKGLQLNRNDAKIIKDTNDQLNDAQNRQTDLDNKNIQKLGQNYNRKTQLQIARLDGDVDYVRQLQTINELISKGIITNQKDLQRVRAEYEKLLILKQKADEDAEITKINKMERDAQSQNNIAQAVFNYDLDRANTLKFINDLKAQGIKIDQQELRNNRIKYQGLLDQQRIQRQLKLKQSQRDQGNNLVIQAMKQAGFARQANRLETQKNAEKIKGARLTQQQIRKANTLADLQTRLSEFKYNFDTNLDIKTNEMTARGGFASGAVVPDTYDVNNQIRDAARQSNRLLQDIRLILQNGGII